MNESFFEMGVIQKKIETHRQLRFYMKGIGALIVFLMFFGSLSESEQMRVAWFISIPIICMLFGFEVVFIKKIKRYELELYRLEKADLEAKKEMAEMRGEVLPDYVLNREIREPSKEISLPVLYYVVLIILDILVKVMMIH